MSARTIFLHVGPPKTGTSAIQAQLRSAPPSGLLYPFVGQWHDGAHHQLVFALKGMSQRGAVSIPPLAELAPAMRQALKESPGNVLISSEAFDPVETLPAFLTHFSDVIANRFTHVVPVVVLRHPVERAASMYNQRIKDALTDETQDPDSYLATAGSNSLLAPLVRRWKEAFEQTLFLDYAPANTLVPRFYRALGYPAPPETSVIRRNTSINGRAIIALLIAKRLLNRVEDRKKFFSELQDDKSFPVWGGEGFPFSRSALNNYHTALVKSDLEEVREICGLSLSEVSFPDTFSLTRADQEAILRHVSNLPGAEVKRIEIESIFQQFPQPPILRRWVRFCVSFIRRPGLT